MENASTARQAKVSCKHSHCNRHALPNESRIGRMRVTFRHIMYFW